MTALRSLAVGVSGFVVRHATAGSREWAEGLERELEYIKSDWRALVWAVGSTRLLLDRRGVRAALADGRRSKRPGIGTLNFGTWYFFIARDSVENILKARSPWDRTSAYLVGFAVAYWGVTSFVEWRREGWQPAFSSDAYSLFSRRKLELKLTRSRMVRQWLPIFGIASGITGLVMYIEGGMRLHHISSIAWIAIGAYGIHKALSETPQTIQRQIEQIDTQIANRQIAKARQWQPDVRAHSDHWGRSG